MITVTTSVEKVNGYNPLALAEAEAIRKRADAEAEALRIEAEGKAKAEETRAREEAEKQRLANEQTRMRVAQKQAEHDVKMAELKAQQEEIERQAAKAREEAEAEEQAEAEAAEKRQQSADSWRIAAKTFYAVCQVVALPVQIHAFWSPHAPWLAATPLVLEGGAWVVQRGTRAAVDERRPYWHYRLIAWCLAFLAAGINLGHGLSAFDVWTAVGTAFCSVAGPGVDDLHEHGRIRVRDGKLTRRERRAKRLEEKRTAALEAEREAAEREEKEAAERAVREAAEELDRIRREEFAEVHRHARRLAAAWGETAITPAAWRQAHIDIEGTEPGESVDIIRGRNAAARRVAAARSEAPGNTPSKVTSTQRGSQMPAARRQGPKAGPTVRGVRRPGDTAKYPPGARKQMSITAKTTAKEAR